MRKIKKLIKSAKTHANQNVAWTLRDKDGNIKPIFVLNALGEFLLRKGWITPHTQNFLVGRNVYGEVHIANLITNAGKAGIASRINGAGAEAAFDYIAIGTGSTAADATDTTLETELSSGGMSRASATTSRTTTDVTNDTARNIVTFSVTATAAITESGVLNAASSGTLLCRQVFTAINVTNGDSLQATWDIDVD